LTTTIGCPNMPLLLLDTGGLAVRRQKKSPRCMSLIVRHGELAVNLLKARLGDVESLRVRRSNRTNRLGEQAIGWLTGGTGLLTGGTCFLRTALC